jgi:hypothetical protein
MGPIQLPIAEKWRVICRVTRLGESSPKFAQCFIANFGKWFEKYKSSAHLRGTFSPWYQLCIHFEKNGLGYILGDFFINSSGHPGHLFRGIFPPFQLRSYFTPGLPCRTVCISSYQKAQFRYILESLGMENVGIFYGHLVKFVVIWFIFPVLVCFWYAHAVTVQTHFIFLQS